MEIFDPSLKDKVTERAIVCTDCGGFIEGPKVFPGGNVISSPGAVRSFSVPIGYTRVRDSHRHSCPRITNSEVYSGGYIVYFRSDGQELTSSRG